MSFKEYLKEKTNSQTEPVIKSLQVGLGTTEEFHVIATGNIKTEYGIKPGFFGSLKNGIPFWAIESDSTVLQYLRPINTVISDVKLLYK